MTPSVSSAEMVAVLSPADGTELCAVPSATADEVRDTVARLRTAQPDWEASGVKARVRWLREFGGWLMDNQDSLHRLLQQETGKPWGQATMELGYVATVLDYYARNADRFLAEQRPRSHSILTITKRQRLRYRPYPVVGVLTPWNFPLAITLCDAIPALLAGAAVVVKPSEVTPLAVRAAVSGWRELDAPDVFDVLTGAGETGSAITDCVDYVQFTGSTATGRRVAGQAAQRLIPFGLELGGKDPLIVLRGADLERAANAAVWGAMANSGQMCTSIERAYVEAAVYDEFVALVEAKVRDLRVGHDDQQYRYDIGPLATQRQRAIVVEHLDDAVAKGAHRLTGDDGPDSRGEGNVVEPTVLLEVDHSMVCMNEETFGPLLPIMRVHDVDEAVALANDSSYGLSATLFGPSGPALDQVARRLEVGAVNVNDVFANLFTLPLPQAGWKASGIGARNGGAAGLLKYCRPQALVTARIRPSREPQWFPYARFTGRLTTLALRIVTGHTLRRRLDLRRPAQVAPDTHE